MKKNIFAIIIVISLIIIAIFTTILIIPNKKDKIEDKETCSTNSDCETPMEYLIQSNCPFSSACINQKCRVICPLSYHDPNPKISKSYNFECITNSDCDCSWRGNKSLECLCIDGSCASIEG